MHIHEQCKQLNIAAQYKVLAFFSNQNWVSWQVLQVLLLDQSE